MVNTLIETTPAKAGNDWYAPFIAKLAEKNISTYYPDHLLTRGEMAQLIYQVMGK